MRDEDSFSEVQKSDWQHDGIVFASQSPLDNSNPNSFINSLVYEPYFNHLSSWSKENI